MSGRSIRAAVANPRTPSTTLSSSLPPAAARIVTACPPRAPLWHSSLSPWPDCPADHLHTEHRAPQSLHPRARCGCEARGQEHRYVVAEANPAHRRLAGAAQAAPGVRLLAAQIGRLDDLRVAPDGVLLAEVEVVVGHLLGGPVLGQARPEHL